MTTPSTRENDEDARLVYLLHRQLTLTFHRYFGPETVPWTLKTDEEVRAFAEAHPGDVGTLLPSDDNFCLWPGWGFPLPKTALSLLSMKRAWHDETHQPTPDYFAEQPLENRMSLKDWFLINGKTPPLIAVQIRILKRANGTHLWRNTLSILHTSIEDAERQLAAQPEQSPGGVSVRSTEHAPPMAAVTTNEPIEPHSTCRHQREMRLQWLRLYERVVRWQRNKNVGAFSTKASEARKVTSAQGLIKPKDLDDAWIAISGLLANQLEEEIPERRDALGYWYRAMLRQCGMNERELDPNRDWAKIAWKKYLAYQPDDE